MYFNNTFGKIPMLISPLLHKMFNLILVTLSFLKVKFEQANNCSYGALTYFLITYLLSSLNSNSKELFSLNFKYILLTFSSLKIFFKNFVLILPLIVPFVYLKTKFSLKALKFKRLT